MSSFELFDEYGVDNCNICLIEQIDCSSKNELRKNYYKGYNKNNYYNCINNNFQSIVKYLFKLHVFVNKNHYNYTYIKQIIVIFMNSLYCSGVLMLSP